MDEYERPSQKNVQEGDFFCLNKNGGRVPVTRMMEKFLVAEGVIKDGMGDGKVIASSIYDMAIIQKREDGRYLVGKKAGKIFNMMAASEPQG